MTVYREDNLEGAVGAVGSAADIGMTSMTGAPEYAAPGWKTSPTSVLYDGTSTPTYARLTYAPGEWQFEGVTVKIDEVPTSTTRFMRWDNVSAGTVLALRCLTDGRWEATSTSDAATSRAAIPAGDWIKIILELNQASGQAVFRLYDRQEQWIDAIRVKVGGQAIVDYYEGSISSGLKIRFSRVKMSDDADPIYVEQSIGPTRPNIFYTVYDDASANILPRTPAGQMLLAEGTEFTNFINATPLCSPARASMYSGRYPHNNGVTDNHGYNEWTNDANNDLWSYARLLDDLGVVVYQGGKHLNGYNVTDPTPTGVSWFFGTAAGTQEFDYKARQDRFGTVTYLDTEDTGDALEAEYLTDVLREDILAFLTYMDTYRPNQPYMIFAAPFGTHEGIGADPDPDDDLSDGAPPAPRDRPHSDTAPAYWDPPEFPATGDLGPGGPQEPGGAPIPWPDYLWPEQAYNWNTQPRNKPGWHTASPASPSQIAAWYVYHQNRIRTAQSVSDMVLAVIAKITAMGDYDRTWVFHTSDNGFHLGEQAVGDTKGTPYDASNRLPLYARPPGGMSPRKVDALVSSIDHLPTWVTIMGGESTIPGIVDGRSYDWMVSESTARSELTEDWRQTLLVQYFPNGWTWEQSQGTGEPPAWYMLRSKFACYITYEREQYGLTGSGPPDTDYGEAYDLTVDPGQMSNIYSSLQPYQLWPAHVQLMQYLSGVGKAAYDAGLSSLLWSGSDSDSGEAYVFDGVDLSDDGRRWVTTMGTDSPGVPVKITSDVESIGSDGLLVSDDRYDDDVRLGPAYIAARIVLMDYDPQGRPAGPQQLQANRTALMALLAQRGTRTLGIRPAKGLPVEWEARARVLDAVTPQRFAPGGEELSAPFQLPDGQWRSRLSATWRLAPWVGGSGQNQHVFTLAGSSAPIRGAIVRITAPCTQARIYDLATGHWAEYRSAGPPVDGTKRLLIDLQNWRAVIVPGDTWDFDTALGVDVSAYLDSDRGAGDLLVLQPDMYGGDPQDRRVYITAEGAGRTNDTVLEIRAARTRHA